MLRIFEDLGKCKTVVQAKVWREVRPWRRLTLSKQEFVASANVGSCKSSKQKISLKQWLGWILLLLSPSGLSGELALSRHGLAE